MLFFMDDARASVSSNGVFVNRGIRRLACQPNVHRSNESAITAEALMNHAGLDYCLARQLERASCIPLQ
jgi:hypothetical protein